MYQKLWLSTIWHNKKREIFMTRWIRRSHRTDCHLRVLVSHASKLLLVHKSFLITFCLWDLYNIQIGGLGWYYLKYIVQSIFCTLRPKNLHTEGFLLKPVLRNKISSREKEPRYSRAMVRTERGKKYLLHLMKFDFLLVCNSLQAIRSSKEICVINSAVLKIK